VVDAHLGGLPFVMLVPPTIMAETFRTLGVLDVILVSRHK
jgi:hypothetical protein